MPEPDLFVDTEAFERDGYAVLRGAVPADLCDDLVDAINVFLGIGGPETWYDRPAPFLDLVPLWGHPKQWAIRQLPVLRATWAHLLGTDDLLVSLDRCRFTPPWRPGEAGPLPMHWDHDPRASDTHFIQGAISLTDTPVGHGGFRCAPGWHRKPERWPQHRSNQEGDWTASIPDEEVVSVPMAQGDLVLWTSRLPHANSKNESHQPRYSFYVLMTPFDEEVAADLIECWRAGTCQKSWRDLPGHQHAEPWAPVPLDENGRRLIGLDRRTTGTDSTGG